MKEVHVHKFQPLPWAYKPQPNFPAASLCHCWVGGVHRSEDGHVHGSERSSWLTFPVQQHMTGSSTFHTVFANREYTAITVKHHFYKFYTFVQLSLSLLHTYFYHCHSRSHSSSHGLTEFSASTCSCVRQTIHRDSFFPLTLGTGAPTRISNR